MKVIMKTKVKTFRFTLSKNKIKGYYSGRKNIGITEKEIDDTINEFLSNEQVTEVIDIKINKVENMYHNNGGFNHIDLIYTIIYI